MITLEELLKKEPVYMDLFGNREEVYEEFFPYEVGTQYEYNDIAKRYLPIDGRYTDEFRKEEKILFAYYSVGANIVGFIFLLFFTSSKFAYYFNSLSFFGFSSYIFCYLPSFCYFYAFDCYFMLS